MDVLQENYGRAKETFAHTQALWEKEIRRARKETFKTQSGVVKLQEELKAARSSLKMAEENVERERERSRIREQEAFSARYQLVGVQEQLEQALERIKLVEQERDAFKMLAKEEEIARIAAEGQIPLPVEDDPEDEFASPKKKKGGRVSISTTDVLSSAAAEEELEELRRLVQWERRRADRALEQVEFLQTECQLRCCACVRASATTSQPLAASAPASPERPKMAPEAERVDLSRSTGPLETKKAPRRSTIFIPSEGIFVTVSEEEAKAHIAAIAEEAGREVGDDTETAAATATAANEPITPTDATDDHRDFTRTPSVEPPTFAMLRQQRTSLLSLLDAPHQGVAAPTSSISNIPTVSYEPVAAAAEAAVPANEGPLEPILLPEDTTPTESELDVTQPTVSVAAAAAAAATAPVVVPTPSEPAPPLSPEPEILPDEPRASEDDEMPREHLSRPHTSAAFYTVTTTTTVPLRDANTRPLTSQQPRPFPPRPASACDNDSGRRNPAVTPSRSFDSTRNLVTPTVTREQALAQIRERRGRVRSADQQQQVAAIPSSSGSNGIRSAGRGQVHVQGQQQRSLAATPRRPAAGIGHRDVSAPATVGGKGRVPSGGSGSARGR